jgi:hypothetical protein
MCRPTVITGLSAVNGSWNTAPIRLPSSFRRRFPSSPHKSMPGATGKGRSERQGGAKRTRSKLYAEAKRHNIPGRSKMSKKELEHALH